MNENKHMFAMLLLDMYKRYLAGEVEDKYTWMMKEAAKQFIATEHEHIVKPILDMDKSDAVPDSNK